MREGFRDWSSVGSAPGLGSNLSYANQDYRVTTMHLRERASTGKAQSRRTPRSMTLKSASSFQNRNLDNYPMLHNREDVMSSAKGQRAQKRDTQNKMNKVKVDSGSMKEYSKQMFDFAINSVRNNGLNGVKNTPHRTDKINSAKTNNGPTNDGSILYNNKQQVLNSIRIRPHTEQVRKYNHERVQSSKTLNDTIIEKNQLYKVLTLNDHGSRRDSIACHSTCSSTEFVLIPLDQSSERSYGRATPGTFRRITVDMSMSEFNDNESVVTYQEPFDDPDGNSAYQGNQYADNKSSFKPVHPAPVRALLPPSATCKLRLVSLNEESSSESDEEPGVPPPEVKPAPPKAPLKEEPELEEKGKLSIPEPEPEVKPVKVKRILKGPRCWVDDMTVSSDQSEHGADDFPDGNDAASPATEVTPVDNAQKPNITTKKDATVRLRFSSGQVNDSVSIVKLASKENNPITVKECVDMNVTETVDDKGNVDLLENQANGLKEDDSESYYLPPFICPSSERKSREAAIKDWLSSTCFRSGNRGVPLV